MAIASADFVSATQTNPYFQSGIPVLLVVANPWRSISTKVEMAMSLRDKLRSRSQPFLQPGETIQEVFPAQAGNPWMVGLGGGLLMLLLGKPRDVVVTDRAVVVLRQSKLTATPQEVLGRLPRDTRIGPAKGIWAKTELNGEMVWIHRRFHGDVGRADAALTSPGDPISAPTGE